MSSNDGAATPRPQATNQPKLKDVVDSMTATLDGIEQNFVTLSVQSTLLKAISPTTGQTAIDLEDLRKRVRLNGKQQKKDIAEVKRAIREDIKKEIMTILDPEIRELIKAEVCRQVAAQVEEQMIEHIPVPLRQQKLENQQQLEEVKVSYKNSEARRRNSRIEFATGQNEALNIVMNCQGQRSELYPYDLRSLCTYKLEDLNSLLIDHELGTCGSIEEGLNQFVAHIGITARIEVLD
ncbi:hypothetical protein C8J56DRAFT_453530 [Mycena floridula]|nr:hypothetical protein C8J56DRAFT_453530 [Mycena floridula]